MDYLAVIGSSNIGKNRKKENMALFLSGHDDGLLRPSVGRDPLGLQPIWTTRARDLVPHLTAQSNRLEGFQVLLSIFGLWPAFQRHIKDEAPNQLKNFYLLVEQAIARSAWKNGEWPLPGQRRLKGGSDELVISLKRDLHLAYGQLSSGTWGLYRGAAERANLLNLQTLEVAEPVVRAIQELPLLQPSFRKSLFDIIKQAIDSPKQNIQFPNKLALALAQLVAQPPLKAVLMEPLMRPSGCLLTGELSTRLAKLDWDGDYRALLARFSSELSEHRETFEQLVRCEQWLAPLEASFEWLCGNGSLSLKEAASKLPVNLADLRVAQQGFRNSGDYKNGTGKSRHTLYGTIEHGSTEDFIVSLLEAHRTVSEERGAGPWALLNENGRLEVLVPMNIPDKLALEPSKAWRNDYYLWSLWSLSRQMIGGGRKDG